MPTVHPILQALTACSHYVDGDGDDASSGGGGGCYSAIATVVMSTS